MGVFLAILMMMTTGSVAIFILVLMLRKRFPMDVRIRVVLAQLVLATLVVFSDMLFEIPSLILRLPFDVLLSLFPMLVITSSVWKEHVAMRLSNILSVFVVFQILLNILQATGVLPVISQEFYISFSGVISIMMCLTFLLAIYLRMREIRHVMKCGNVWSYVCFSIDVIYLLIVVIYIAAFLLAVRISMKYAVVTSAIVSFLIACEIAALGLRIVTESVFLIWRRQERCIIESMKISHTDVVQESSKINDMYKDIYARILTLFETDKPYLNSELTINDIVKVTFTNKLYISRAISQFTGRNFCQFVNYYRVLHSIQIFRENPDLKVIELATRSGFNSTVSYSMAFRLYMSECPSDWCRKEKLKLRRRKK